MKKAVIIGCLGQDGTILYNFLEKKGYKILGIDRDSNRCNVSNWTNKIDITNTQQVFNVVRDFKPDEIYHLAAFHHSSEDALPDNLELFHKSYQINVLSLINFLEGINSYSKKTRLFYASSSHVFGFPSSEIQDEDTPFNPVNIYGLTKACGLLVCRYYRNSHSVFVSTGILYNHESALRTPNFLSKKIVLAAINIKKKKQDKLVLGDLKAEIDWGYAPDYVDAMYRILNLESAGEFVIATGEKHTVLEFVEEVFSNLDLDWKKFVKEDTNIIKRKSSALVGNSAKLRRLTSWKPTVNFKEMVKILLKEGALNEQKPQKS